MSLGSRQTGDRDDGFWDTLLGKLKTCDRKLKSMDQGKLEVKELSFIADSALLGASVTTQNLEEKLKRLTNDRHTRNSWYHNMWCCRKTKKPEEVDQTAESDPVPDEYFRRPDSRMVASEIQSPTDIKQNNHLQNLIDLEGKFKLGGNGKASKPFDRGFNTEKPVLFTSQLCEDGRFETPTMSIPRHITNSVVTSSFSVAEQTHPGEQTERDNQRTFELKQTNQSQERPPAAQKSDMKYQNDNRKWDNGRQNGKPLGHSHLPVTEVHPSAMEGRSRHAQHKYNRNFDIDQYLSKTKLGQFYLVKHLTRSLFVKFTECHIRGNRNQLKKGRAGDLSAAVRQQTQADHHFEENGSDEEPSRYQRGGQVTDHTQEEALDPKLLKFYEKRYTLFSKYDEGIKIDNVGWYSVTPEKVARAVAERLAVREKCLKIVDFFSGLGGNSIQFALAGVTRIDCIELDPVRHEMAIHNAEVYGVSDKITHVKGDVLAYPEENKYDAVFASPPWGGTEYSDRDSFSIFTQITPAIKQVVHKALKLGTRICLMLPKNTIVSELMVLFSVIAEQHLTSKKSKLLPCMEVEKVYVDKGLVCMHVYFGNFETFQGPQLVDAIVSYLTEDLTLLQVPNATGELFQKNLAGIVNQLDLSDVASLITLYEAEERYTLSASNRSLTEHSASESKPAFRLRWFSEKMSKLLGEEHSLVVQLHKMCKGVKRSRPEDRPKVGVLIDLDEGIHRQQVASEAEIFMDKVLFSPGTKRLPDFG